MSATERHDASHDGTRGADDSDNQRDNKQDNRHIKRHARQRTRAEDVKPAIRRRWDAVSLTLKITMLFCLIAGAATIGVGMSLYDATRTALSTRADYQLIARVEHMRTLLHDLYTVQQLEARPALFETMLGNEQDVIVFRKAGNPPSTAFIYVNPENIPLPRIAAVPPDKPVTLAALHDGDSEDGFRMRWIAARANIGNQGETVEIIAAHVMTQEAMVLSHYRQRVLWTIVAALAATAMLGTIALRRGLRPLRDMAHRASEITPERISTRFSVDDAPSELRQFAVSFNAMLDRLANGYHRLVQFSADLAHELRTPIGVLIGQTQVTLVHPRSALEYRQLLESNLEELERIGRIAQNILFLAQADHETQAIERVELPLHATLDTIQTYFEGLAEERNLRFALDAKGTVTAHPDMFRRAISNVVVNAVRYAAAGTTITISGEETPTGIRVVVGNQGSVINSDDLGKLFDRFYRGDASRSEFTESSGLGLAIVRAIMTMHGGTASITCSPQGWIELTLFFPRGRGNVSSAGQTPTHAGHPDGRTPPHDGAGGSTSA